MKPKQATTQPEKRENCERLRATFSPDTANDEQRTVDVVWFTGIDVPRRDFEGPYLLRFDPKGLDMSRLENGAPVLNAHDEWDMSGQLGVVAKAWQDGKRYLATLRFSRREEVNGIWQDIKDRIIQNFSMGVFIDKREVLSKAGELRLVLATAWTPFEISLVPVPADPNTTTLAAAPRPLIAPLSVYERELEALRFRFR